MSKGRTVRRNRTPHEVRWVGFGIRDKRGREIGAAVLTFELDYIPAEPGYEWATDTPAGHYYGFEVRAARDGEPYGASQRQEECPTEAERTARITPKIDAMRLRYERRASAGKV